MSEGTFEQPDRFVQPKPKQLRELFIPSEKGLPFIVYLKPGEDLLRSGTIDPLTADTKSYTCYAKDQNDLWRKRWLATLAEFKKSDLDTSLEPYIIYLNPERELTFYDFEDQRVCYYSNMSALEIQEGAPLKSFRQFCTLYIGDGEVFACHLLPKR